MWCFFLVLMLPWRWLAWRGETPPLLSTVASFIWSQTSIVKTDCHSTAAEFGELRAWSYVPRSRTLWTPSLVCSNTPSFLRLVSVCCHRRRLPAALRNIWLLRLIMCDKCYRSCCTRTCVCVKLSRTLSASLLTFTNQPQQQTWNKEADGEETKASKHSEYESICRTLLTFRLTVQISTIQTSPRSFCRSPNSQRPAADGGRQIHKTQTRVRFSKTKTITNPNKVQKPSNGSPVSTEQLWRDLKDVPNLSCKLVSAEPVEIVDHTKQVQNHLWCKHNTRFRVTSRNKFNLETVWIQDDGSSFPNVPKGCTWNGL